MNTQSEHHDRIRWIMQHAKKISLRQWIWSGVLIGGVAFIAFAPATSPTQLNVKQEGRQDTRQQRPTGSQHSKPSSLVTTANSQSFSRSFEWTQLQLTHRHQFTVDPFDPFNQIQGSNEPLRVTNDIKKNSDVSSKPPPLVAPIAATVAIIEPSVPKPSAPLLPFKYAGSMANKPMVVYQQELLDLHVGLVIENTWRVTDITSLSITFEYIPLKELKKLNLE
jgi:hypothetical protein